MTRNDSQEPEELEIARLLRAAGRRPELPDALKDSWEARFRAELEPIVRQRTQRKYQRIAGLCATAAVLIVAVGLSLQQPATPELVIRVSTTLSATLHQRDGTVLPLQTGHYLRPGSEISTGAGGHTAIDFGGYDLRLNGGTRIGIGEVGITLHAGELYASDEGVSTQLQALEIGTPQAVIRDIGTQFLVAVVEDQTVATVRTGAIVLATHSGEEFRAEARADSAGRLTAASDRTVRSEALPRSSVDWQWIYRAGPEFNPDGQTIHAILSWSTRETGLQLEFASESARIHALTNDFHGPLPTADPARVIANVLATTDLAAQQVGENVLRIALPDRS